MTTHTYGKLIQCGHTHYVGCDPCGCEKWVKVKPDTVTITISRKAAKTVADWPDDERFPFSSEFGKAARAALGKR
jgi:sarcosine oxidase delta subunit